jgi:outer membrane immunogenic protein
MIKNTILSLAMCCAFGASALAADLPTMKGPPPAPPATVYNWTGFYLGANVGGAWDHDEYHFVPAGTFTSNAGNSVLGGGQIGYNYQISNFVAGVEGDFDGAQLSSSAACPNPFFTCGHAIDWLASARARAGFLPVERALVYVTGGAAFSDIHHVVTPPGVAPFAFSGVFSSTQVGWALGAGVEYAFIDHWSAKVEYIHYGFGTVTAAPGTLSAVNSTKVSNYVDTFKAGLNYHF